MANRDFQRNFSGFHDNRPSRFSFLRLLHVDWLMFVLLTILCCYGLLVLFSAADQSYTALSSQIKKILLSFVVMLVVAQLPPRFYQRLSPLLYIIGVLLLLSVLMFGSDAKGAQRWIGIPGLPRFQPSEFMKIFMPMMISWYLAERVLPPKAKYVYVTLLLILLPTAMIAAQPDLGTSILIASSGLFVLFLAGIRLRIIFSFIASALIALPLLWMFYMHDYQKQRVLTFLNPELDPHGSGWNIIQSKTAIGSGGFTGKGWLSGTQSHLDFLPESSTDFIIAVLAEEFGFVGVLFLLIFYLGVVARGIQISLEAQNTYNRLLAGSITLTFFVYVFVNIGMVSGILPVVGMPLPLVSVGGTSLVSLFIGFGLLMSIHSHKTWLSN